MIYAITMTANVVLAVAMLAGLVAMVLEDGR